MKFVKKPVVIDAFELTLTAQLPTWVNEGVRGEIYPCKPDIFKMTYEPVRTE